MQLVFVLGKCRERAFDRPVGVRGDRQGLVQPKPKSTWCGLAPGKFSGTWHPVGRWHLLPASLGLCHLGDCERETAFLSRAGSPGQTGYWAWASLPLPGCLPAHLHCRIPLAEAGNHGKVRFLFLGGSFCRVTSVLTLVRMVSSLLLSRF